VTTSVTSGRWRAASVAAVALGVPMLGVGLANVPLESLIDRTSPGGSVADLLFTAATRVPAAGVGTLVAACRPRNPLGWILLTIFLIAVAPVNQYAVVDYRLHRPARRKRRPPRVDSRREVRRRWPSWCWCSGCSPRRPGSTS
jgi:hypothetical protein